MRPLARAIPGAGKLNLRSVPARGASLRVHPPDDLCSYAVRDFVRFPLDSGSSAPQPVAACVGRFVKGRWQAFHKGGLHVAFDDGSARFVEWTELGVEPPSEWDDPTTLLGPGSPVEWFRALSW